MSQVQNQLPQSSATVHVTVVAPAGTELLFPELPAGTELPELPLDPELPELPLDPDLDALSGAPPSLLLLVVEPPLHAANANAAVNAAVTNWALA